MKCKHCELEGKQSNVFDMGSSTTLLSYTPFYDAEGQYHNHNPNRITHGYMCSNQHRRTEQSIEPCINEKCNYGKSQIHMKKCKCTYTHNDTVADAIAHFKSQCFCLDDAFIATNARLKAKPEWMPTRATDDSAAWDVRFIAEKEGQSKTIYPNEQFKIDLGFKLEMPHTLCAKLLIRSGLGTKHYLRIANNEGLIESDYQDNLLLTLHNYSGTNIGIMRDNTIKQTPYTLKDGERVAQIKFEPSAKGIAQLFGYDLKEVLAKRTGGHGSTGKL